MENIYRNVQFYRGCTTGHFEYREVFIPPGISRWKRIAGDLVYTVLYLELRQSEGATRKRVW